MSAPKLRFAEFKGELIKRRISDFAVVKTGSRDTQDRIDIGQYPFFVRSNTIERINSFAFDGEAILTSGDGVGVGKNIHYIDGKFDYHQRVYAIREFTMDVDGKFFFQFFREKFLRRVMRLSAKNSVDSVRMSMITEMAVTTPPLPEQKKIAAFLGAVDDKVAALQGRQAGLERYKHGLMQALFNQRLRFTKPDGTPFPDWEEKRLGDVATRSSVKNKSLKYMRVLTNSAVHGVIDQRDYFDKEIANAENLAGYYVLKKGDFVYNPRISVSAPVGPIKRNDLGDGVMSPLYTVFRFKEKDTEFFNTFFATTFWHKYMRSVANYGARHDRMAITSGDLMNMPLPFPQPEEQQKIADALSAMDTKIRAVAGQVAQMQTFKKGLLQQMFV